MAAYTNISQSEIESFLSPQGFRPLTLPGVRELVYAKRVDRDGLAFSLRVYTGINPDGASREVGRDAIRCVLFYRLPSGDVRKVATSKRVHRVAGWRKNLQERLDTLRPGPRCRACGSPMVLRKSTRGEFYGCSNYPTCKQTAPASNAA